MSLGPTNAWTLCLSPSVLIILTVGAVTKCVALVTSVLWCFFFGLVAEQTLQMLAMLTLASHARQLQFNVRHPNVIASSFPPAFKWIE